MCCQYNCGCDFWVKIKPCYCQIKGNFPVCQIWILKNLFEVWQNQLLFGNLSAIFSNILSFQTQFPQMFLNKNSTEKFSCCFYLMQLMQFVFKVNVPAVYCFLVVLFIIKFLENLAQANIFILQMLVWTRIHPCGFRWVLDFG